MAPSRADEGVPVSGIDVSDLVLADGEARAWKSVTKLDVRSRSSAQRLADESSAAAGGVVAREGAEHRARRRREQRRRDALSHDVTDGEHGRSRRSIASRRSRRRPRARECSARQDRSRGAPAHRAEEPGLDLAGTRELLSRGGCAERSIAQAQSLARSNVSTRASQLELLDGRDDELVDPLPAFPARTADRPGDGSREGTAGRRMHRALHGLDPAAVAAREKVRRRCRGRMRCRARRDSGTATSWCEREPLDEKSSILPRAR